MLNSPCRNCPDRKLKCHGNCSKYEKYKETVKAINAELKKAAEDTATAGRYSS